MKRLLLMFAAVAVFTLSSCNEKANAQINDENLEKAEEKEQQKGKYPVMSFEEKKYDFGTVKEGEIVKHQYKFTNTGEAPLVITKTQASCGCTVANEPEGPIAPGESDEIGVSFNSRGKPGVQTKNVTITANTEAGTERITITGKVTPKAKDSN